ncbi:oxygen-insensitive NAD(P)H nitroreductase [Shewanella sp. JM162201]|uniref:Oxygen-insensitive NAD(P)H nitroreductase n=1 Tax=Shewanella jiangmenensis TaxID=2837387 RepID=A0ABS5UZX7_9GAMM|nr:oxygen-insensitive NAD(P)H nitroreductase [Shewanella jiangmenensis]MBT1443740.1 oxygen-insensitive NAD(P)H nitroreductase [Shewanella jiangmenensis]
MQELAQLVRRRHTCKAFDPNRKISPEQVETLKTLLQFSPSSTNSQPWHFVLAGTEQGKATIARSTEQFGFNTPKILNASHVLVLCTKAQMDEAHLLRVLEQEQADGRFADEQAKQNQHNGRSFFVNMHRFELKDAQQWMEKQIYLALGTVLLGAAAMEIDACPIEGFDATVLNRELGLREKGLCASVVVALGYRSDADFNANMPKSRLPQDEIFTLL